MYRWLSDVSPTRMTPASLPSRTVSFLYTPSARSSYRIGSVFCSLQSPAEKTSTPMIFSFAAGTVPVYAAPWWPVIVAASTLPCSKSGATSP